MFPLRMKRSLACYENELQDRFMQYVLTSFEIGNEK
jgi:hypothetical protein